MLRKFKKFLLRKQVERCLLRQIRVDEKLHKYHNTIMEMIVKGENEFEIERVKLKRDKLYNESYGLIDKKYSFMNQLRRA